LKPVDVTKNEDGTPNKKRNPWRFNHVLPVTLDSTVQGGDNKSEDSSRNEKNEDIE